MLTLNITHLNGEHETIKFFNEVSVVVGKNHTRVLEFTETGECIEHDYNYELGSIVTVRNWGV